jgi:hypothetical protein
MQAGATPQVQTFQDYSPATYTSTTIITTATPTELPPGPAPQPLPSSQYYTKPVKAHKGWKATLTDTWHKLTHKAERAWTEATDERFRRHFGFPFTEVLYGEFYAEVWTANRLLPCSVFISQNHLCILAKFKEPASRETAYLKHVIPLRDVVSIQKAISLPSIAGGAPVVQAVIDPNVRPDSVQVFTRDFKLHQFCHLYDYDKFYQTLDYAFHQALVTPYTPEMTTTTTTSPTMTSSTLPSVTPAPTTTPAQVTPITITKTGGTTEYIYTDKTTVPAESPQY